MNQSVLKAVPRAQTTKGELNKLRAQGQIPAVIYGGGEAATHVLLDEKEFLKIAAGASESTILGIDLDGTKKRAFVKARQRDCLTNRIIHVDLLEVISGRLLHARVPLHLVGVPVGVREGGVLENPAHEIEVECDPDHLPERIEVDVSELHANHSIHVRELKIGEKVKVLSSPELVVAVVKFAKEEVVETPAAAPAEGAAVEGAVEGAAAAPGAAPGTAPATAPGAASAAGGAPAAGAAPAAKAAGKKEKK
jgi:large subunit ribosomal protein L25